MININSFIELIQDVTVLHIGLAKTVSGNPYNYIFPVQRNKSNFSNNLFNLLDQLDQAINDFRDTFQYADQDILAQIYAELIIQEKTYPKSDLQKQHPLLSSPQAILSLYGYLSSGRKKDHHAFFRDQLLILLAESLSQTPLTSKKDNAYEVGNTDASLFILNIIRSYPYAEPQLNDKTIPSFSSRYGCTPDLDRFLSNLNKILLLNTRPSFSIGQQRVIMSDLYGVLKPHFAYQISYNKRMNKEARDAFVQKRYDKRGKVINAFWATNKIFLGNSMDELHERLEQKRKTLKLKNDIN